LIGLSTTKESLSAVIVPCFAMKDPIEHGAITAESDSLVVDKPINSEKYRTYTLKFTL
jgi:hypothetical protein